MGATWETAHMQAQQPPWQGLPQSVPQQQTMMLASTPWT
eukprot:CAMPEP_0172702390 /NCGR_PEP_ID=MMETSP1074-20121228/34151_1 /TAXON_ID=2916 /ORGANISM="Ceratium fusus, Strain PA161109" /LENGTH=38 /DNA_ID= /DNA_START= /DNA_END= /DNA_ORIENTATION=